MEDPVKTLVLSWKESYMSFAATLSREVAHTLTLDAIPQQSNKK